MSENQTEQEPSIEEILASIRQIISDDEEDQGEESKTEPAEAKEEVVEDPIRHKNNDVLELTEADLVDEEEVAEEEPEEVSRAPVPDMDIEMVDRDDEDIIGFDQADEDVSGIEDVVPSEILSSSVQAATMSSLSKLTKQMPIDRSRSYDGTTLEDIVRELLHPMLREWMDDHLPRMVERIVQKELEKLARRALDD